MPQQQIEQTSTPEQLVDALNGVFGPQQDGRAVHAKGIVVTGTFTPGASAAALTRAPHFQSAVPVTVRFSNFPGVMHVPDADAHSNPRGMAIKFHLPDGSETDIVAHSFNGFPAATADEFRELLLAIGASGPGAASPTPLDLFLGSHPIAKAFLEGQAPPPVSYATLDYFGVNSFAFSNAGKRVTIGRYRVAASAGVHYLATQDAAGAAADYLADDLRRRLTSGAVDFTLLVQVAGDGDAIDNPSIAWPDDRHTLNVGRFELTAVVDDSKAVERALLFAPGTLPDGITSADPMIGARQTSYRVSYQRRHEQ